MANIPLGNFGQTTPGAVSAGSARGDFGQSIAQGLQQVGNGLMAVADEHQKQKQAMARAKSVNEVYNHELFLGNVVSDINDKIRKGELKYQDAQGYYEQQAGTFSRSQIDGLDAAGNEQLNGVLTRNVAGYAQKVKALQSKYEQDDYKNQFVQGLDTLGKQRQIPGADIEQINKKSDVLAEMAKRAGIDSAVYSKTIQDFKDAGWYQHASERAMKAEATNNVGELQALQHDLTSDSGFYIGKMDTEKRNAVLKGVTFDLERIRQRAELAQAKADAKGERALAQFNALVATGANPSQEAIDKTLGMVKGTSAEAEFRSAIDFSAHVQEVLKKPITEQIALANEVSRKAMESADSATQVAQAKRLASAIQANVNTLQKDPLKYQENQTGQPIPDLPLDALGSLSEAPAAAQHIAAQLSDRWAIIKGLENKNGIALDYALLKPTEAEKLGSLLSSKEASVDEKQKILASLRDVSGSTDIYKSVLKQLQPKAPVMAYAGAIAASDKTITFDPGIFSKNQTLNPQQVAATLLKGERILDEHKFELPPVGRLQEAFSSALGDAYQNSPDAYQADFDAVRAYYAGAVSEEGSPSKIIDSKLIKKAIHVVVGQPYKNGDSTVLPPYGMQKGEFADKLDTAWKSAARGTNHDGVPVSSFNLRQVGMGKYQVFSGQYAVPDSSGKPITLDVGGE